MREWVWLDGRGALLIYSLSRGQDWAGVSYELLLFDIFPSLTESSSFSQPQGETQKRRNTSPSPAVTATPYRQGVMETTIFGILHSKLAPLGSHQGVLRMTTLLAKQYSILRLASQPQPPRKGPNAWMPSGSTAQGRHPLSPGSPRGSITKIWGRTIPRLSGGAGKSRDRTGIG